MCHNTYECVVHVVDGKWTYRSGFLGLQDGWMWMLDRCGCMRMDTDTCLNVVAQHVEYIYAHLPGIVSGVLVLVPEHAGHHATDVSNNINGTQGKRA